MTDASSDVPPPPAADLTSPVKVSARDTSEERSQRASELEAIRQQRQLAKARQEQLGGGSWSGGGPAAAAAAAATSGAPLTMDSWRMQQRQMAAESRRKQNAARETLHKYQGHGIAEDVLAGRAKQEEQRRKEHEAKASLHKYQGHGIADDVLAGRAKQEEERRKTIEAKASLHSYRGTAHVSSQTTQTQAQAMRRSSAGQTAVAPDARAGESSAMTTTNARALTREGAVKDKAAMFSPSGKGAASGPLLPPGATTAPRQPFPQGQTAPLPDAPSSTSDEGVTAAVSPLEASDVSEDFVHVEAEEESESLPRESQVEPSTPDSSEFVHVDSAEEKAEKADLAEVEEEDGGNAANARSVEAVAQEGADDVELSLPEETPSSDEKARNEKEEKAKREAEEAEKARKEAEEVERTRKEAEAEAKMAKEAEEMARKVAEEEAEKARIEEEESEKARIEANKKAKKEAEENSRKDAEQRAKKEAEKAERDRIETEKLEKTRKEAEEAEMAKKEAEEKAKKEAEEKAKKEAEEKAKKEAEEKAKKEAEEKAKKEAEEKAKKEAEEKAKKEAEEKAKKEAEEKAKKEAEEKAKKEAEENAKKEAEEKAKKEAEEKAKKMSEEAEKARKEAEAKAKAKKEAEEAEKAAKAAERRAKAEKEAAEAQRARSAAPQSTPTKLQSQPAAQTPQQGDTSEDISDSTRGAPPIVSVPKTPTWPTVRPPAVNRDVSAVSSISKDGWDDDNNASSVPEEPCKAGTLARGISALSNATSKASMMRHDVDFSFGLIARREKAPETGKPRPLPDAYNVATSPRKDERVSSADRYMAAAEGVVMQYLERRKEVAHAHRRRLEAGDDNPFSDELASRVEDVLYDPDYPPHVLEIVDDVHYAPPASQASRKSPGRAGGRGAASEETVRRFVRAAVPVFVKKDNVALAKRVRKELLDTLRMAVMDGSFAQAATRPTAEEAFGGGGGGSANKARGRR